MKRFADEMKMGHVLTNTISTLEITLAKVSIPSASKKKVNKDLAGDEDFKLGIEYLTKSDLTELFNAFQATNPDIQKFSTSFLVK